MQLKSEPVANQISDASLPVANEVSKEPLPPLVDGKFYRNSLGLMHRMLIVYEFHTHRDW